MSPVTSSADVSHVNVVLTLMGNSVKVDIIHFSCLQFTTNILQGVQALVQRFLGLFGWTSVTEF